MKGIGGNMGVFKNTVSEKIWQDRYQKNGETYDEHIKRICSHIAQNEVEFNLFYDEMSKGHFFGAGRVMSNSGIGKSLTLNNCFTANFVPDSMEGIFDRVKLSAIVHQKGGGIGHEFSHLRPKDTPTSNDAVASGVISFMTVFDAQTRTVQAGSRRGANMSVLSVHHPDIEDYISAKSYENDTLTQFNMSIMIDDDFLNAVKNNSDFYLHYPVYDDSGIIVKDESKWTHKRKIKAKELWDKIIESAYLTGEPGLMHLENMNKDNNTWYCENIVNTNP